MRIPILILALLQTTTLMAQRNTFLGAEIGEGTSRFEYVTNSSSARNYLWDSPRWRISVRHEPGPIFSLEAGVGYLYYEETFAKSRDVYVTVCGRDVVEIPLLVAARLPLYRDRIIGFASTGLMFWFGDPSANYCSTICYMNGDSIMGTYYGRDIPNPYLLWSASFGARFRVVDEVLITP